MRTQKQEGGTWTHTRPAAAWRNVEACRAHQASPPRKVQGLCGDGRQRRSDRRRVAGIVEALAWPAPLRRVENQRSGANLRFPKDKKRQEAVPHRGRRLVALEHDTLCRLRSPQEPPPQ